MTSRLSLQQTIDMFMYVADRMEKSALQLNEADQAIGDGDHGEAMARGWHAAGQALRSSEFNSIGDVLSTVGTRMMASMGGASGAIFGTWFKSGSKSLMEAEAFSSETLAILLGDGLEGVQARGHAKLGDKTMVDALEPAAAAAWLQRTTPLSQSLPAAAAAAQQGTDATKEMVAHLGRARTLGDRAKGHPDPGALSTVLILQHMAAYLDQG